MGDDERVTRLKLRPTRTEDPNPKHRSTTSFPPTTAVTGYAIGLRKQGFQGFTEFFCPWGLEGNTSPPPLGRCVCVWGGGGGGYNTFLINECTSTNNSQLTDTFRRCSNSSKLVTTPTVQTVLDRVSLITSHNAYISTNKTKSFETKRNYF